MYNPMRNENEMMELILNVAKNDDRIRAVYMNGSRVNPDVAKDKYRDYDIVFVVTEMAWFMENNGWLAMFGDPVMIQEPDKNVMACGADLDISRSYGWLMLFKDGNRIDLHIETAVCDYGEDSLTVTLLDKDGILPAIPPPSDKSYHIKKPSQGEYTSVCNNFWWCLQNVAKGIARDQLTYAMNMYVQVVHGELEKMVTWHIGADHGFDLSVGMWGKYYKKYLTPDLYDMYARTYADADYNNLWNAIFTACGLFRDLARSVGGRFGYRYNEQDDENMTAYLMKIKDDVI